MGQQWKQWETSLSWAPKSLQMVTAAMKLKHTWKESYDKHRQHFKTRDITLPTKFYVFKAIVFSISHVWIDSWTIKKAEHWRINAFRFWCWRRLLKVLWTSRGSNKSILKEIYPEYSLKWLMLKSQYFGHLMWRVDSLEKFLRLGKTEGKTRRGQQRMRWLVGITN